MLEQESLHAKPYKRSISNSFSPLGLPDINTIGSQDQCLSGARPRTGCLMWGTKSLLFKKKFQTCEIPVTGSLDFKQDDNSSFLLIMMWPFYSLLWKNSSASFHSFSERIVPYVGRFGVPMGGGEIWCVRMRRWVQDLPILLSWTAWIQITFKY